MGNPLENGRIAFGDFELDPERRVLTRAGETVALGSKAFDILLALIENRGHAVTKELLLERVWQGQFVEENNLTVQIAAIRKALGERKGENRYIATVPGRGYRFVGDVRCGEPAEITIETREVRNILIEEYEEDPEPAATVPRLPPAKRTPGWRWAALLVILAVAAGGGWMIASRKSEQRARFDAATMTSRIFAVPGAVPQRVALSPDGRSIAYSARANGKDSLWIGDLGSNTSLQLTEAKSRLHNALQFSPDGKTLYFTAKDENHPAWTLMSVSASGGAVRDFGVEAPGDIAVSPDGERVAYFAGETGQGRAVHVKEVEGTSEATVLLRADAGRRFAIPYLSWSAADGTVTAAMTDADGKGCSFVSVDPHGGRAKQFTHGDCGGIANFEWIGDGREMAITETLEGDARRTQVRMFDPSTGERRDLTNDAFHYTGLSLSAARDGRIVALEVRNLLDVAFADPRSGPGEAKVITRGSNSEGLHGVAAAPDGKLLYTVKTGTSRAIWEANADGTGARELLKPREGREEMQLNVTADNRHIVFDSNRTGAWRVWRANRDGSGAIELTHGVDDGDASVTPDGRFVIFRRTEGGSEGVWRVPVEGGEPSPIVRSGCAWPDVSPDGRLLACSSGGNDTGAKRRLLVFRVEGGEPVKSFSVPANAILYNRLRWAPDGRSILYKDLIDGLWEQPLDSPEPRRIERFDGIRVFHLNRAGERIVYAGGLQGRNIVIIEPSAAPQR